MADLEINFDKSIAIWYFGYDIKNFSYLEYIPSLTEESNEFITVPQFILSGKQ